MLEKTLANWINRKFSIKLCHENFLCWFRVLRYLIHSVYISIYISIWNAVLQPYHILCSISSDCVCLYRVVVAFRSCLSIFSFINCSCCIHLILWERVESAGKRTIRIKLSSRKSITLLIVYLYVDCIKSIEFYIFKVYTIQDIQSQFRIRTIK